MAVIPFDAIMEGLIDEDNVNTRNIARLPKIARLARLLRLIRLVSTICAVSAVSAVCAVCAVRAVSAVCVACGGPVAISGGATNLGLVAVCQNPVPLQPLHCVPRLQLRMFRLSRLYRKWRANFRMQSSFYRLLKLFVIVLMLTHSLACFWHLAAVLVDDDTPTWLGPAPCECVL